MKSSYMFIFIVLALFNLNVDFYLIEAVVWSVSASVADGCALRYRAKLPAGKRSYETPQERSDEEALATSPAESVRISGKQQCPYTEPLF